MDSKTFEIPLEDIKPDPNNPRKHVVGVESLAQNMRTEGLIHPIEVDKDLVIIVGERRYRAAKLLGWENIKAIINEQPLPPYERLRRQMSENLHQSGAKNGEFMNPLDTAKGWARLYELKTGKPYQPGLQVMRDPVTGQWQKGAFLEIAEEVAAEKQTVWEYLKLLDQPEYVQDALADGTPRTYFREADKAPEEVRDQIKQKVAAGEYKSREEIIQDVELAKQIPDLAQMELERQKAKSSQATNKILNYISRLALAMQRQPAEEIDERERTIVLNQLNWLREKIDSYLI